jgi:O-antigen chain-terminating methyltransferase
MAENSTDPESKVDVEAIIQKVRRNIQRRQMTGDLPLPPGAPSLVDSRDPCQSDEAIQRDLSIMHTLWDLQKYHYTISSHHRYLGKILVRGRQLVHGEVRRYVDPIITRQTEFNASTVRILSLTSQQLVYCNELLTKSSCEHAAIRDEIERAVKITRSELAGDRAEINRNIEARYATILPVIDQKIQTHAETQKSEILPIIDRKIQTHAETQKSEILPIIDRKIQTQAEIQKSEIRSGMVRDIDARVLAVLSRLESGIQAETWLAHCLEERVLKATSAPHETALPSAPAGLNYLNFEQQFRGSRESITIRQEAFVPIFKNASQVLDIGCGRGEFLEILRDRGICGTGVEPDADMVEFCRSRQLNVIQSDAISFLEQQEDMSLGGVFMDQVVEHLESAYFIRMLALCYRKMKPGNYIVAETVNPLSFASFVNFYIDLTHKRPIHPSTLQYLMGAAGFEEIQIRFSSPFSDEERLKWIPITDQLSEAERSSFTIYNRNVDLLNSVLWGPQDYAVIARKPV